MIARDSNPATVPRMIQQSDALSFAPFPLQILQINVLSCQLFQYNRAGYSITLLYHIIAYCIVHIQYLSGPGRASDICTSGTANTKIR